MRPSLLPLPAVAMAVLLAALLLLDLAFYAVPEVMAAFVPAVVWGGIILVRRRR